jgi:hypothetical protein
MRRVSYLAGCLWSALALAGRFALKWRCQYFGGFSMNACYTAAHISDDRYQKSKWSRFKRSFGADCSLDIGRKRRGQLLMSFVSSPPATTTSGYLSVAQLTKQRRQSLVVHDCARNSLHQ